MSQITTKHECNGLLKPRNWPLKIVQIFLVASKLFEAILRIFKKSKGKNGSFCVPKQRDLNCYFLKTSSLTTYLEY